MGRRVYDWAEVQRFHDEGHGFRACRNRFGLTHYSWMKAVERGDLRLQPWARPLASAQDGRRVYDWPMIQAYYDEGHTFRTCRARFGFSNAAWHKATRRGDIRARRNGMSVETLLLVSKSRHAVKTRLMNEGILVNVCDICGLRSWRGQPISMHLDHINGVKDDNRLENLRMLCPNCHSQTPTYGGRNIRRRALQEGANVV